MRKTCKTERAAQIELGKLLGQAAAGRQPDSDVTVAQLLDQYVSIAGWDVSTRASNLGYIRRTIKPRPGVHAGPQDPRPADALAGRDARRRGAIPGYVPAGACGPSGLGPRSAISEQVHVDGPLEGLRT